MLALLLVIIGSIMLWLALAQHNEAQHPNSPTIQTRLSSGSVASMESPIFSYSPSTGDSAGDSAGDSTADDARSWVVNATGADPSEPADPWSEPSGVITFTYSGSELALQLAVGNYWGYIFITVDGEPANLLPNIANNHNSMDTPAGYKTFYEPEKAQDGAPIARWLPVHRSPSSSTDELYTARVEVWRSWGQVPIRGVAVDALPADPWPAWPGALLIFVGLGLATFLPPFNLSLIREGTATGRQIWVPGRPRSSDALSIDVAQKHNNIWGPTITTTLIWPTAIIGFFTIIVSIITTQWIVALFGLTLLGAASLFRPSIWLAALLFALPFYFGVTVPILHNRAIGLIDIGILGGVATLLTRIIFGLAQNGPERDCRTPKVGPSIILFLIIGWAFVTTFAADQLDVAFREWRTIFLYAGLFALLFSHVLRSSLPDSERFEKRVVGSSDDRNTRGLLVGAWLAGGTVVALIALAQWITDTNLIEAEGVFRVRALYGSPNNLALYLDRTLAVTLALAVFGLFQPWDVWKIRGMNLRIVAAVCALVQLIALLLTYSRGSTMLALPVTLIVLMVGGWIAFRHDPARRRQTWWLAGVALIALLVMAPSINTERVAGLLDLESGTGFLRRQIWRSGWQMALDHPIFGVGPDNFLYAFRSDYLLPAAWQEPNLNHPHNFILDLWTRLGVPGLLLALGGLGMGLWKIVGNIWRGWSTALNLGLLATVCAALAHGLIDVSYALPDLMLVWVAIFAFAGWGRVE